MNRFTGSIRLDEFDTRFSVIYRNTQLMPRQHGLHSSSHPAAVVLFGEGPQGERCLSSFFSA